MALGIGATTAMFTLIQGVLLRPLPVHDQDRLIVAWNKFRSGTFDQWPFGVDDIEAIGRESRLFERVAGVHFQGAGTSVAVEHGEASYIRTASVTGTFFNVLGVAPILGRALEPADDVAGAEKVLVITHGLWQRRYGGGRDVIGRRLMLREQPFTIVGVMPSGLDYPRGVEGWMTVEALAAVAPNPTFADAVRHENDMVGRLRQGVTRAQAIAELEGLVARLEAERRDARELLPVVRSFEEVVVGDVRPAMLILFAAVALVLLIASANVANLLLLRGEARRAELAVRAALGASRGRIAAQLLAESLLLALASAAVGLAASRWVLQASLALVPGGLPRVESVRIDGAVVVFTAAVAFLAAGLAGLAPALYATRTDLVAQLRTGRQYGTAGARHGRRALVGAQVALAVVVVAAAGLLTRSLLRLQHVELGLSAERVLVVALSIPPAKDGDRTRFDDAVVAQLDGIPGVEKATPINNPPLTGINGWESPQSMADGQTPDEAKSNPSLSLESVYPNHFATLGVPIVRGREFTEADRAGAPEVAIVSADVAARFWPGEDPIGKRLRMGNPTTNEPWQTWRTVVGVVNPIRYRELALARATLYLPARQFIDSAGALLLRTALPPEALAAAVRDRVRAVDPTVRVMAVVPFRQFLEGPLARPRFHAFVIGLFGASALLLATVGLYSVMAAYVRQRYPEIGIRVALGATASDVRRLVLGEGLRLAGLGAAIGLAGAVAGARVLRGLVFGVHPLDPVSLLGAAVLLVSASALACSLPAWRATRVDPAVVLRTS